MRVTLYDGVMKLEPEEPDEAFHLGELFGQLWNSGTIESSGGCLLIDTGAVTVEEYGHSLTISKSFDDIEAGRVTPIEEVIEGYRAQCGD
jgi:hypothetical protein